MSLGLWAVHAARPWRGTSRAGPRGEGARPAHFDIAPDDTRLGFCTVLAVIPLYGLVLGRAVAPDTAPGARVPDAILCVELCYLTALMTTQWFFLALREVGIAGPDSALDEAPNEAPKVAKTEASGEEGASCRS